MEAEAAARRGRSFARGGGGGTGGAGRARGAARERSAPGAAAAPGSRPRRQPAERSCGRGGDGSSSPAGGGGSGAAAPGARRSPKEPGGAGGSPQEPRARGARGAGQGALRSVRSEGPPGRAPRTGVGSRLSPAALAPAPGRHPLFRGRAQTTKAEDAAVGQGQDLALKPGGGAHAFPRTEKLLLVAGACSRGGSRAPRRSVSCLPPGCWGQAHPSRRRRRRSPPPRRQWGLVLSWSRPAVTAAAAARSCQPGEDRDRAGSPLGRRLCLERGAGLVPFSER